MDARDVDEGRAWGRGGSVVNLPPAEDASPEVGETLSATAGQLRKPIHNEAQFSRERLCFRLDHQKPPAVRANIVVCLLPHDASVRPLEEDPR